MSKLTKNQIESMTVKDLRKFIDRRHPAFKKNEVHWNFLQATYDGGRQWFEQNIFRYHKEGDEEFKSRKARAYRFNHTREVVDLINKYIFKSHIHRSENAPEYVKKFWKGSTIYRRPIEHLMRLAGKGSSISGRVWLVIDSAPVSVSSEKEAKDNDARSYGYIVTPQNALDMAYGEDGELNWWLCRETARLDENPLDDSGDEVERFRLWTRDQWVLFRWDKEAKNISKDQRKIIVEDMGDTDIGMVPVIAVDHNNSDDKYTSTALIADIAYLDRAVGNYLSNLDAIIQDQTFSQLVLPSQAILPGDDEYKELMKMGTKRIFTYNGEAGQKPEFISPDVKQANIIISVISKIIGEIYHSIGMAGERTKEDNAVGIDNSSGVAKAYDFERMNAMLANKANALQEVEKRIVRLVMAWNGDYVNLEDMDDYVTYPESFDVRGLQDEFSIAERLNVVGAPKSVRREQIKSLVDKLFPQLAEDIKKEIHEEVMNEWLEMPDMPGTNGSEGEMPQAPVPGKENNQGQVTTETK